MMVTVCCDPEVLGTGELFPVEGGNREVVCSYNYPGADWRENLEGTEQCVDLGQKGHSTKDHGGHRGSGQAPSQEKKHRGQWFIVGTCVS